MRFGEVDYVYRYSTLFAAPVILQADHEKRFVLIWSAYANRALAMPIGHDLRARDLEVVSTPANALLLYNSRNGEFINALTGQTTRHERPTGFTDGQQLFTEKLPWKEWKARHQPHAAAPGKTVDDLIRVLDRVGSPIEGPYPADSAHLPDAASQVGSARRHAWALAGLIEQPILIEPDQLPLVENTAKVDGVPLVIIHDSDDFSFRVFDRQIMVENLRVPVQLAVNEVTARSTSSGLAAQPNGPPPSPERPSILHGRFCRYQQQYGVECRWASAWMTMATSTTRQIEVQGKGIASHSRR